MQDGEDFLVLRRCDFGAGTLNKPWYNRVLDIGRVGGVGNNYGEGRLAVSVGGDTNR